MLISYANSHQNICFVSILYYPTYPPVLTSSGGQHTVRILLGCFLVILFFRLEVHKGHFILTVKSKKNSSEVSRQKFNTEETLNTKKDYNTKKDAEITVCQGGVYFRG